MSRADSQALVKKHGIKADLKRDDIIEEICVTFSDSELREASRAATFKMELREASRAATFKMEFEDLMLEHARGYDKYG